VAPNSRATPVQVGEKRRKKEKGNERRESIIVSSVPFPPFFLALA
jgi:hypothetical protein